MMRILEQARYRKHLETRGLIIHELWLPMLLFGSMGAIAWAIRGSSGWGGVDGTVVPGIMWGLLWYYLCLRKGIDARGLVLWLGLGIGLGGELGYGQYVAWIQGKFYVGNEIIPIAPWIGYVWFIICGIGWAAPGGIILGWALGGQKSVKQWFVRSFLLLVLLVLLFAWPFVDWLSIQIVQICPDLLFPNADLGIYSGELDKHLGRTVYTNTQNFAVLIWFILAIFLAALQKDRVTVISGLVLGVGFGIGFMQSALWCLGYSLAPNYIGWWKMWELNAGFNLGLLYVVMLYWASRQVYKAHQRDNITPSTPTLELEGSRTPEWFQTFFLTLAGFVLIFFMGFEYFFWTGIILGLIYVVALCLATYGIGNGPDSVSITEKRNKISLIFSVFLLVFLLLHGGSSRAGVLLELYSPEDVDQYAWPVARIVLFVPAALTLLTVVLFKMWQSIRSLSPSKRNDLALSSVSIGMVDLMMGIGFIGAVSIWPLKIGVLYAFFLFLAIFAVNRLNRRFDNIDAAVSK